MKALCRKGLKPGIEKCTAQFFPIVSFLLFGFELSPEFSFAVDITPSFSGFIDFFAGGEVSFLAAIFQVVCVKRLIDSRESGLNRNIKDIDTH